MNWFSALPVQVQAALIGAAVTLAVLFVRDLIFRLWEERREVARSTRTVFRRYADPLAYAATSLLWRLHEIFYAEGRAVFLRTQDPRTRYESYKRRSTFYRLGSVLGWLRALRRELSFVSLGGRKKLQEFEDAIGNFEHALADGPHVEIARLDTLASFRCGKHGE